MRRDPPEELCQPQAEVSWIGASVKTVVLSGVEGRVLEVTALAGPGCPGLDTELAVTSDAQRAMSRWHAALGKAPQGQGRFVSLPKPRSAPRCGTAI